jgi:hypothetical protein
MYEGENYFDTRNTRKHSNCKKDPQKVKWQSRHSDRTPSPSSEEEEQEQDNDSDDIAPVTKSVSMEHAGKKTKVKGANKRDRKILKCSY